MIASRLPLLALTLSLSACQAPPKPVAMPRNLGRASMTLTIAEAPIETTRAPEAPQNLVAHGRIMNLRLSWNNVERLLRTNGGAPIGVTPELLSTGLLGPTITDVIDFSAPVDVAAFDEQFDRIAVAMGIDAGVAPRLGRIFRLAPKAGLLHIKGIKGENEAMPSLGACGFTTNEEGLPDRLVCASDEELLEEAGAFVGKTLARRPSDGDVRIDLDYMRLVSRFLDDDKPSGDDYSARAGDELGRGLLRDLEKISLGGAWGSNEIDAEVAVGLAGASSPLSRILVARPSSSAPPPAVFSHLPREASLALYGQGADAATVRPLRDLMLRALRYDMAEEGYDDVMLDELGQKVSTIFFTGGPFGAAFGVDRSAAEAALAALAKETAKDPKATPPKDKREAAFRSLRAWAIFGVEEPAEPWTKTLPEIVSLMSALDKKNDRKRPRATPTALPKAKNDKDDRESTKAEIIPPPASLPKGSLHLELSHHPLVSDAPPPYKTHFFVVPDGSRTWLGFGSDEPSLLARLRVAREGGPDKTLEGLPELDLARVRGASAGGFFTITGASMLMAESDRDAHLQTAARDIADLATLPSHGDARIPFVLTSESGPEGDQRASVKARLSLVTLADLVAIMKR